MNIREDIIGVILTEATPQSKWHQLKDDDDLIVKGLIDSLGLMKLIAYMEDKYEISIDDNDIIPENFQNLKSIVNLIQTNLEKHMD